MAQEKAASSSAVPIPFRGLRVLLLDNDTESLLDTALKLENFSYKVTTTELEAVALSILQERPHNFDLVMADTNMTEMDCFKFIKNVHLIRDFPIILMYSEPKKDMVIKAATKGKCFCLKKPVPVKNLKNVWQYVYRKSMYENIGESVGAKVEEESRVLDTVDSLKIENDVENVEEGEKLKRRSISTENGEFKRKRVKSLREIDCEENKTIQENSLSHHRRFKFKEVTSAKEEKEADLERELENIYKVRSPITKLSRATSLPAYPSKLLKTSSNPNKKFHSVNSSPQHEDGSNSLPEVFGDLQKQLDGSSRLDELPASAAFSTLLQEGSPFQRNLNPKQLDEDRDLLRW